VFKRESQVLGFERTKEKYTREYIDSFKGKGCDSSSPIIIVGMPRSGTTLTEQIISSHPSVFGAGELTYLNIIAADMEPMTMDNCAEIGQTYVDMTRKIDKDAAKAEKITDKMPGNYMRLGQIVASLPNAKIIHCRRNPIDTTLSCYKQLFSRGHYWSYNQEEMVEHYMLYNDMMQHWRDTVPDKFLEINYEDTVNDFENQARMLIDYVGLEWNDACLTPHKTKRSVLTASKGQVRKPIYKTSVEAWRRYEDELKVLVDGLSPLIKK